MKRKTMKFIMTVLAFLLTAGSLFAEQWTVETPEKGMIIFRNDNGKFKGGSKAVLYMSTNGMRLKKTFPLEKLPADALKSAKRAVLRIYCNVTDASWMKNKDKKDTRTNGLNENLCVLINGHQMIFKTSDPRFSIKAQLKDPQYYKWTDIEFPIEWIKNGKMEVIAYKLSGIGGDDYFYPAIDITVPNDYSQVSFSGGAKWSKNGGNLKDGMGEYMMRLLLFDTTTALPANPTSDYVTRRDLTKTPMVLKNAVRTENMISFAGNPDAPSRAILHGTDNLNITDNGFTISGVFRFREPKDKSPNMMLLCKDNSFFIGRTNNVFNVSFSAEGVAWSHAMVEGEVPAYGEWFHLAVVFERIHVAAQGQFGYNVRLYLNGDLYRQKALMVKNRGTVNNNKNRLFIGAYDRFKYNFCGDVAEIMAVNRVIAPDAIARMAAAAPNVSARPAGSFDIAEKTAANLAALKKAAKTPAAKWVVNALERSAATGADAAKIAAITAKTPAALGLNDVNAAEMVKKFNAAQNSYRIFINKDAMMMSVINNNAKAFPVAGMFDRKLNRAIFADRTMEWRITCMDSKNRSSVFYNYSNNFPYTVKVLKENADGAELQATWKSHSYTIISNIKFAGKRLSADISVRNTDGKFRTTEVMFPAWRLNTFGIETDAIVYPRRSGIVQENPTKGFNFGSSYPTAEVAMQFSAYYDNKGNGIYFGYEDPDSRVKNYSISAAKKKITVNWATKIGYAADGSVNTETVQLPEAVIELYNGEWFEAGQIYKRFLAAKAPWWIKDLPRKDTPEWYRNNCFFMCASANPSFAKELAYIAEYMDAPCSAYWAWWHNRTGDYEPRYVPKHPRDVSDAMVKLLKDAGVHLMPYVNPHLWAYAPGSKQLPWKNSAAPKIALKDISGDIISEPYGTLYPLVCHGSKEAIRIQSDAFATVAAMGFGGLYLDQLPCGMGRICYANNHGHLLNDGSIWAKGRQNLMKETRRKCREINPEFCFDGEDASDPYLSSLDGYMTWRWVVPGNVPLFQSIFSGRIQFTGKVYDANSNPSGEWEAVFQKASYQVVNAEQISWLHINDLRHATPHRLFLKKMVNLRYGIVEFLNSSDMIAPVKFRTPIKMINSLWGTELGSKMFKVSEINSGAYQRVSDKARLYIFINSTKNEKVIDPIIKVNAGEKVYGFVEKGSSFNAIPAKITLAPRGSALILIGKDSDTLKNDAAKFDATLNKIAGFTDCGKILFRYGPGRKTEFADASNGKFVPALDAVSMGNAYRPHEPTFCYDRKVKWIQCGNNAEINWGKVDFGTVPADKIEIDIASADAGGIIEFRDKTSGEIIGKGEVPVTDWFVFKPMIIKLQKPVSGKMELQTLFKGKTCIFRKWRTVK